MERAFHRDNLRNITQRIVRVATQTAILPMTLSHSSVAAGASPSTSRFLRAVGNAMVHLRPERHEP